jgi:hypothetical protein
LAGGGGLSFFWSLLQFALPKALCDFSLHHEYLMLSFRIIYLLLFFLVMLKSLSYSHLLGNRDSETLMLAAQEDFRTLEVVLQSILS